MFYSNGINEKQGPLNNPLKTQEIPRQQENYYFSNDKSSGQKQFELTKEKKLRTAKMVLNKIIWSLGG